MSKPPMSFQEKYSIVLFFIFLLCVVISSTIAYKAIGFFLSVGIICLVFSIVIMMKIIDREIKS